MIDLNREEIEKAAKAFIPEAKEQVLGTYRVKMTREPMADFTFQIATEAVKDILQSVIAMCQEPTESIAENSDYNEGWKHGLDNLASKLNFFLDCPEMLGVSRDNLKANVCKCGHSSMSHRDKGYDADVAGSLPGQGSCTENNCNCEAFNGQS